MRTLTAILLTLTLAACGSEPGPTASVEGLLTNEALQGTYDLTGVEGSGLPFLGTKKFAGVYADIHASELTLNPDNTYAASIDYSHRIQESDTLEAEPSRRAEGDGIWSIDGSGVVVVLTERDGRFFHMSGRMVMAGAVEMIPHSGSIPASVGWTKMTYKKR